MTDIELEFSRSVREKRRDDGTSVIGHLACEQGHLTRVGSLSRTRVKRPLAGIQTRQTRRKICSLTLQSKLLRLGVLVISVSTDKAKRIRGKRLQNVMVNTIQVARIWRYVNLD
ncbi:hypothetical protein, variant 2 [Phytophthora nicotianae P1569]|uniref:Uncharacterized protein n=1 Tax=Phytophthora nicotianae P1569 TaxID=1317065 RepID=V9DY78_PHYNI|nr:hypothetical protein F443_21422 [Phytophthora nicotianae P1569]ETI31635.1 hypothetical protein, variant 1 [Phytophthora nicotianae P1569]ETI31636.1 hypothetical protein, variant 2 [Phytophthora nicotianae P1569]